MTSAVPLGSRCRRRWGPSNAATVTCGLIRRISSRQDAPTRQSCFAWRYRMGTATWPSSALASHASTARAREASTLGCTDEIAARRAVSSAGGASRPASQRLATNRGSGIRKNVGAKSEPRHCRQPRSGLDANPAQRTGAARFTGFAAAHWIARGVEKDSATSTNGPETGQDARTMSASSEYERHRSVGYRTVAVLNASGVAFTKSVNSSPVPSIPGNRTSVGQSGAITRVPAASGILFSTRPAHSVSAARAGRDRGP